MQKMVLVEGKSGFGKTTSTKYLGSNGFRRYSVDDYLDMCRSPGIEFLDVLHSVAAGSGQKGFVDRLYAAMPNGYNINHARSLLVSRQDLTPEANFAVAYAVWSAYMMDRNISLSCGDDVAMDAFVNDTIRENLLRIPHPDKIRRFLLRLHVPDEVAIERKMKQKGWPEEKASRGVKLPVKFSDKGIDSDVIVLDYRNTGDHDDLYRFIDENILRKA